MIKVTMNLTEADAANATFIESAINARSRAQAVSFSLTLARFIIDQLGKPKTQLLIRNPDGTLDGIRIPELEGVSRRMVPAT
jgi:hypothetical protein